MNITIDTSAAQKSTVLSSAKMTGVSKTSEKSEAKTAQTTAKKYDTLDLSEMRYSTSQKPKTKTPPPKAERRNRPTTP